MHDVRCVTLRQNWTSALAHHHIVLIWILAISHWGLDVLMSPVMRLTLAIQLRKQVRSPHAQPYISALPWWWVKRVIVRSRHKGVVALQIVVWVGGLRCMAVLRNLGYRLEHCRGDGEDVLRSNNGADVAETGERIPHERVELQRLYVVIDSLFGVAVRCPELP